MGTTLGLVVIIIVLWQVFNMGRRGLVGLRIAGGAKKRRSIDSSSLQLEPPQETKELISALNSLEFHRLGEAQVKLPDNKPVTIWVLVNPDDTIQAETVYDRLSLSTYFQQDVLLVTDYPNGEQIEMPKYQSHFITSSVNDAYRHHLEQIDLFSRRYGPPHTIQNMNDYLRWETMGRVNYGNIKLRRFMIVDVVRISIFVYSTIICVTIPLLYKVMFHSITLSDATKSQAQMELLIIGLILPFLFIPPLLSKWLKTRLYKKTGTYDRLQGTG